MQLLILGGGRFVGYHLVLAARARGWAVTVFNHDDRPPVSEGVRWCRGDRTIAADMSVLADRSWDIVVDTWAGDPFAVEVSVAALRTMAQRYCYVSSVVAGADVDFEAGSYGQRKREAEEHVLGLPHRGLVVRLGLVLGPHEYCGRLPYWLRCLARERSILAPGRPERPIRYHDVRDAASVVLAAAESGRSGLRTASPAEASADTIGSLLHACARTVGRKLPITWVKDSDLLSHDVAPWTGLPLWLPESTVDFDAYDYHGDLPVAHTGLTAFETAADTWKWMQHNRSHDEIEPRGWMPYAEVDDLLASMTH